MSKKKIILFSFISKTTGGLFFVNANHWFSNLFRIWITPTKSNPYYEFRWGFTKPYRLSKANGSGRSYFSIYISFSKGYQLELSAEQIQKIHRYRETGKFVNSIPEFQKITSVSLSWIEKYHDFFKFPDWVSKVDSKKK